MNTKELLIDLCKNLEENLNIGNNTKPHTVKLVSGVKPENYYLPHFHAGTTKTISDETKMAWFVEIWTNDKCIFREIYLPKEGEDAEIIEGFMLMRVLKSVFNYGVMASKEQLNKFDI